MIITSTQAIFGRYCLHCLDEKICGWYFLIPYFEQLKVIISFNLGGRISQILASKNDRLSVPLYTLLSRKTKKR